MDNPAVLNTDERLVSSSPAKASASQSEIE